MKKLCKQNQQFKIIMEMDKNNQEELQLDSIKKWKGTVLKEYGIVGRTREFRNAPKYM